MNRIAGKTMAHILLTASAVPATALAIELTDYTTVDSFYDEAYVTGRFNLKSGNQDQTSFDGSALGYYDYAYSTLPRVLNFRFDGKLDFKRGSSEGASTEEGYNLLTSTSLDNYFNSNDKLFWFGSGELGYRKSVGVDDADDPYVKVGGGVGYGRVINATPLADVLRFSEELMAYGVLTREPSDQTYLELAAIVAREAEFKSRFGLSDYEQHWFDEMEMVLQKAGLLKDKKLGAVGVLKMHQVLFEERISIRKHGWLAKAGVGVILSNYDGSDGDPSLDGSFEYAIPFGHQLQVIEFAKYSAILADDMVHQFHNRLSATYEISDRIDWENQWKVDITIPTEDGSNNLIRNDLSSAFRYYLSNRLDANFSINFTHFEDDVEDNGNDDVDIAVFMGVTYRLR